MIYVVSVSGWRDYPVTGKRFIFQELDRVLVEAITREEEIFVRVGDATGIDEFVRQWRSERCVSGKTYEADWDRYGKAAGPKRNGDMLQGTEDPHGISHMLLGFPQPGVYLTKDSGTWGCIKQAFLLGVRVEIPAQQIGGL